MIKILQESTQSYIFCKKMIKTLILSLLLSTILSFQPCQPFGTRIFYGQIVRNKSSDQKLQIYFNTAQECPRSYVQLLKKTGLEKVQCSTTMLKMSANVKNYVTYVHKCSVRSINFQESFYYNVFGVSSKSAQQLKYSQDFLQVRLADVTNQKRKMNLIVLADWSPLDVNSQKYTPLDNLFQTVSKQKQINGLFIIGDIGYDLDTNNCQNYQKFLVMLSKTAGNIPVIIATGNHQYNTEDNYNLFVGSFQLYTLDTDLAVGIELGSLYLVLFDPFEILFSKKVTKDPAFDNFSKVLNVAKNSKKFVVPSSHYPLACSGTSKNCKNDITGLHSYWQAMLDAKVSLYLGAHYHTYQRIYPYLRNASFSKQASNYRSNEEYLITIVEGVAGNDKDIVESIQKIEDFTASYTVNETGFGLMEVSEEVAKYTHYSAKSGITDSISIARAFGSGNLMRE